MRVQVQVVRALRLRCDFLVKVKWRYTQKKRIRRSRLCIYIASIISYTILGKV